MKPTKRKQFSFLRSYFDVLNKIPDDKNKLDFLLAIINKQFLDQDPENLDFISEFAYESQRHAIEESVKGWKRATKTDLQGNPQTPPGTPLPTPLPTPLQEEEEKEKEKEKEEEKEEEEEKISIVENEFSEISVYPDFNDFWDLYEKKVGKKEKIKKKWDKLPQATKEEIINYLPAYKEAQPDKRFRKNPETFLNNESWKDEIIKPGDIKNPNKPKMLSDVMRERYGLNN